MKLSDLKKKYPHEWMLIEYDELGDDLQVKEGHVLVHSLNKEDIYKALEATRGKNVAIEYAGPFSDDLIVMFFEAVGVSPAISFLQTRAR